MTLFGTKINKAKEYISYIYIKNLDEENWFFTGQFSFYVIGNYKNKKLVSAIFKDYTYNIAISFYLID